jgi:hypothetical protein
MALERQCTILIPNESSAVDKDDSGDFLKDMEQNDGSVKKSAVKRLIRNRFYLRAQCSLKLSHSLFEQHQWRQQQRGSDASHPLLCAFRRPRAQKTCVRTLP